MGSAPREKPFLDQIAAGDGGEYQRLGPHRSPKADMTTTAGRQCGLDEAADILVQGMIQGCVSSGADPASTLRSIRRRFEGRQAVMDRIPADMSSGPDRRARENARACIAAIDRQLIEMKNGVGLA